MGEPHPGLTRPLALPCVTSHRSPSLPLACRLLAHNCPLRETQAFPSAASSVLREACICCPKSQAVEVLGKRCVSPDCPRNLSIPIWGPKARPQVVGQSSSTQTSLLRSPSPTGTPSDMAWTLSLIFIMVYAGDRTLRGVGLGGGGSGRLDLDAAGEQGWWGLNTVA